MSVAAFTGPVPVARCVLLSSLLLICALLPALAQNPAPLVHHTSSAFPLHGIRRTTGADRPPETILPRPTAAANNTTANPWQLQATLSGATIRDISFPTPAVGFAASEGGGVWKTIDGGATWTEILSLGFPYEWEGVHAFDADNVIISGFNDQGIENGLIRWSHDGGATWTSDIQISSTEWCYRPRFATSTQGLILDIDTTGQYTTDGGATAADWALVYPVSDESWYGPEFSLLPDLHATLAGIDYCTSKDAGATWTCGPSVDSVFDGAVFFTDDSNGWVGGGEIAPNVEGWLHQTTDGGKTWSGRVLQAPWPIRVILFPSAASGWAAGGNVYTGVGGIYFSPDGGQTWSLDIDSNGHEIVACDSQLINGGYQVWCAGYSNLDSVVYSLQGAVTPAFSPTPGSFTGDQSVSLSTTTPNAAIYFTTDGSIPTTGSVPYTAPISVAATTTIQAIATAPGMAPSMMASGLFTIALPQLQFTGSAPSVSITAGSSATVQLSVQSTAAALNVTLACSGLPTGAQCSFTPSSINASTQPAAVTLTVSTSATSAQLRPATGSRPAPIPASLALLLPGLLLVGLRSRGRRLRMFASVVLVLVFALPGCGGGSGPAPPQPVQAAVTITATAPGALSTSIQLQLTINP